MEITEITVYEETQAVEIVPEHAQTFIMSIEQCVTAWLAEFKSVKTKRAYTDGITSFRELLHSLGLDVDSDKHAASLANQAMSRYHQGHTIRNDPSSVASTGMPYCTRY